MPTTPKSNRRGQEQLEKNRKSRSLTERASSFHGKVPTDMQPEARIRRPRTVPDLINGKKDLAGAFSLEGAAARPLKLTKLLLNVTVQGCVGAVQVVVSPESTVGDMIAAAVKQYTKEGRRPIIAADPSRFDLHYSQFSLESLDREEKLMELGSRNFFLCPKRSAADSENGAEVASGGDLAAATTSSCSKEVEKTTKNVFLPWLKFLL